MSFFRLNLTEWTATAAIAGITLAVATTAAAIVTVLMARASACMATQGAPRIAHDSQAADSLPLTVTTDAGAVSDKRGTGVAISKEKL